MDVVYLLWHVHEAPDQGEDAKVIGVYRAEDDARAAIERLRSKPGFRHFPQGFTVERYEVNKDCWTEGFVAAVIQPDGTIAYKNE